MCLPGCTYAYVCVCVCVETEHTVDSLSTLPLSLSFHSLVTLDTPPPVQFPPLSKDRVGCFRRTPPPLPVEPLQLQDLIAAAPKAPVGRRVKALRPPSMAFLVLGL